MGGNLTWDESWLWSRTNVVNLVKEAKERSSLLTGQIWSRKSTRIMFERKYDSFSTEKKKRRVDIRNTKFQPGSPAIQEL